MKVETAEICLVVFIGAIQFFVFVTNVLKTRSYERTIPAIFHFSIVRVWAGASLNDITAKNINRPQSMPIPVDGSSPALVNLISSTRSNDVLDEILYSTNTYLLKNSLAAADFHLMKDIAERNIDAMEEDINLTISIPLYLGLMATMIGIVIGLFNMPNLNLSPDPDGKDKLLNEGITLLIGGVKIAMIASFIGLALTIGSSGFIFKNSRAIVEKRKNAYYSFLQTALLPIMNQSIGATLSSLQLNLLKFNKEFSGNLDRLSGLFDDNFETLQLQGQLLREINNMDMVKLARFNLDMFVKVEAAVGEFGKFNESMAHMNSFVESSRLLAGKVTDLMERSENFGVIAKNLQDKLDAGTKMMDFLGTHFQDLQKQKDLINISVVQMANFISSLFKELEAHFKASSETLKMYTIDEITALKKALSDSRTSLSNLEFLKKLEELDKLAGLQELTALNSLQDLDKLGQLEKLSALTGISKGVISFNENATAQTQTAALLRELNTNISSAMGLLEQIHREQVESHNGGIAKTFKKLFGK